MKVRVLVQRAILFARDLRFCSFLFAFAAKKLIDCFKHFVQFRQHLVIPESQHSITAGFQKRCATLIFLRPVRVRASVEFNYDTAFDRTEVGETRSDWMLASEFYPAQATTAKILPENVFRVGLFASQATGGASG
jgi:hypothetical protein